MRKLMVFGFAVGLTLIMTNAVLAQTPPKIGVVDTLRVFDECAEGKRARGVLTAFRDKKQGEITSKEAELKALEEKIKDPKLAESKKNEYMSQFNEKYHIYQGWVQAVQNEMEAKERQSENDFKKKIDSVIQTYARTANVSVIIEKAICLYNAEALDMTNEVIREMDKAYPGS